jgi:protein-L-isoaspartate(D-aspartate) O-methyltransferase
MGALKDARIEEALRAVDRGEFVLEEYRDAAYEDIALPIMEGQTISQPYTVVFMLELLGVKPGETVFDVGYGSGWQTALLAHMVGPAGKVHAAEIVPEVCEFGEANVAKYPELYKRVSFKCGDASRAVNIAGNTFDHIIVAADIPEIPERWRNALNKGGTMVYPRHGVITLEKKTGEEKFTVKKFPGFMFVPFVVSSKQ